MALGCWSKILGYTIPDTKCRCLIFVTLSSIWNTTKEAGTKLIANMTQIA